MQKFIGVRNREARSPLKAIEVQVQSIYTAMNFDLFTRDENGDKLAKIETIRLRGAGS